MPKKGRKRFVGHTRAAKRAIQRVPVLAKREIIRVPVLAEDIDPKKTKILTEFGGVWRLKLTRDQNLALDWLFKKYGDKGGSIFGQPTLDSANPEFKLCVFPYQSTKEIVKVVTQERKLLKIEEEI